jgi:putative ABC transport system permease protein
MNFASDLQNAWRALVRRPGFTLTVVLTLALGVGAVAAMYSVVEGVLLAPAALPEPERVVALHRVTDADEADIGQPDAVDLRAASTQFTALGIIWPGYAFDLYTGEAPVRVNGGLVESGYFASTGLTPVVGRLLGAADDRPDAAAVAVLAESYWRSAFGAAPDVVGRQIELSGQSATIVGVVSDAADVLGARIQVWAPIAPFAPWAATARGSNNFEAIARLAPGATLDSARQELAAITTALAAEHPDTNQGKVLTVEPLVGFLTAAVAGKVWWLLGAVGLLLGIVAVNVASLMLVRTAARERELKVRAALGATQGRIVRQLLLEGALLGVLGAVLGGLAALAAAGALRSMAGEALPRAELIAVDASVFAVALSIAVLTGLLTSVAPAWRARGAGAAHQGARSLGGGERRLLGPLVALEIALALVLLVGATLLLRSLWNLTQVPLGFRPAGVLTAEIVLPDSRYSTPATQTPAIERVVEELARTPGVKHAAYVAGLPLGGSTIGHPLVVEGLEPAPGSQFGTRIRPVHGEYFAAMGIPVLSGRALGRGDRAETPRVAVVNRRFASTYFADQDPLGRRIAWRPGASTPVEEGPRWITIVGVVEDVKTTSLRNDDSVAVYFPFTQRDQGWIRFGELVVEVEGEPAAYAQAMRDAVLRVDARVPLEDVQPLSALVDRALSGTRFVADLTLWFGAAAILLALQGLFGVVTYAVEQRRAELGLRLALGATSAKVVNLVVRDGLRFAVAGCLVGLAVVLAAGRLVESQMYGVGPRDPLVLGVVAIGLLVAAAAAAWLPARRAAATDPMTVLRTE